MNLFSQIKQDIIAHLMSVESLSNADFANVAVELPKDPSHGDVAINAAMVLAKPANMKPRDLAEVIIEHIQSIDYIESTEIAGPGFINLRISASFWLSILPVILDEKRGFGSSDMGQNEAVNVEYVSANPTGPLHVGHARGAVVGDALAGLLQKAGYRVTKEYYINDAGGQIDILARSAYVRYLERLEMPIDESLKKDMYPGEYLIGVGQGLLHQYDRALVSKSEEDQMDCIRAYVIDAMMMNIKEDLRALGVQHDVFTSEKALKEKGLIEKTIDVLDDKGLVYRGILEPPKGKLPDDWEEREQLLFKSKEFGDDSDRALQKSDGAHTYFAADVAYAKDKIDRGFTQLIFVLGADHGGYVKRLQAVGKALSDGESEVDCKLCQLVHLMRGGEPVKMSKRAGNFVTLREVVDEVGKDVLRFTMLTRKNDQTLEFDFDKVMDQSKDNPVFYVQYAHARCKSLLRMGHHDYPEAYTLLEKGLPEEILAQLSSPAELELIKKMALWPRIVETAALSHEPHRIAFYLQELAAAFHSLWAQGGKNEQLRFLIEGNDSLTSARLALARTVAHVIASGLCVLGVEPVEEMR